MPDRILTEGLYSFASYLDGRDADESYQYNTAYQSYNQLLDKLVVAQVESEEGAVAQIIAAHSMLDRMTEDDAISAQEASRLAENISAALYSLRSFIEMRLPPSDGREHAIEYSMPRRSAPTIGDACLQERLNYLIPWVNEEYSTAETQQKFLTAAE